ncbi:MAG: hypothetical protein ACQKBW_08485, partial [Puniceicoccales bacterium]
MRCTIVNRNIPCGGSITGHPASELAEYLTKRGVQVAKVALRSSENGDADPSDESLHLLRRYYDGKNKILRLLSSMMEGRQLARKAASLQHGPVICMTDPPLLNFWMGRQARRRKLPWIYWSMDLYPEAFVAAGLVKADNPVYRFIKKSVHACPPSHLLALGKAQGQHIQSYYGSPPAASVLPCGIVHTGGSPTPPPWAQADGKIILGYVGNLGEAHSDAFVEAALKHFDPERYRFILAASGSKSSRIRALAKDIPEVVLLDSVPREHHSYIDVHQDTLLQHWDHICVPSKAISAICEGGSILFHCSDSNDNWQLLQKAGWRLSPSEDTAQTIKSFLETLTPEALQEKKQA